MLVLTGVLTVLLLCLAGGAHAAIFTVTNTSSSGAGSLHQAILNANATKAADEIHFTILALGDLVIGGDLPAITAPVVIDGYTQPGATGNAMTTGPSDAHLRIVLDGSGLEAGSAVLEVNAGPTTIRGLVVGQVKATGSAISVGEDATDVSILGCFIGTDSAGESDASDGNGIVVLGGATIGTLLAPDRNVISGNDDAGIWLGGDPGVVENNLIGLAADGETPLGNGTGVEIAGAKATGHRIGGTAAGSGNDIAGNAGAGILVVTGAASGNRFEGNRIHSNGGPGIDLGADGVTFNDEGDADAGPNGLQNCPDLAFARVNGDVLRVEGSLESTAEEYRIELFRTDEADESGFGEGGEFLDFVEVEILPGATSTAFAVEIVLGDSPTEPFFVTATAQNQAERETSEFSRAIEAVVGGEELIVTNTGNSGPGSLHDALLAADSDAAPNTIVFAIPGDGPHTIQPGSELAINNHPVILDGYSQLGSSINSLWRGTNADLEIILDGSHSASTTAVLGVFQSRSVVRGLVIHSGTDAGLRLVDAEDTRVEGNFVGTDRTGTIDLGNVGNGVRTGLSAGSRIGGPAPGQRNLISGNGNYGIHDPGEGSEIVGNIVGVDATATSAIGNDGGGIYVAGTGGRIGDDTPGLGNVVVGNDGNGIEVSDFGSGVTILGNDVADNGELGIDLWDNGFPFRGVTPNDADDADTDGGNGLQNFPEIAGVSLLEGAIEVDGLLDVPADRLGTTYTLRLYRSSSCDVSGHGEGERFLGAVDAVIPADEQFSVQVPVVVEEGDFLTATATDPVSGNTSEFSGCFEVGGAVAPLCGDANLSGAVSASDALLILNVAVGIGACELCVCDVNDNGQVQSSDALLALKKGVGQTVAMNCPACA